MASVNPSNPRLSALLAAGATDGEFESMVPNALGKTNPFAYLLSAVEGERKRARDTAAGLHMGRLPNPQEKLEARNRAVAEEWVAQMQQEQAHAEG